MQNAPEGIPSGEPRELSRGGSVERRDGWIILRLRGSAYERGFQHGYFLAPEIREAIRVAAFMARWDTGEDFSFFVKAATELFEKRLDDEILDELKGIVAGAVHAGTELTFEELLAWNGYQDLLGAWWPALGKKTAAKGHRCSAFIATGSATADGSVVAAHNTWDRYASGDHYNVVIDLTPERGHRLLFQTAPGYVSSTMDFWVTDAGLVVTETTIGGFDGFDKKGCPEFYRSRRACQDAASIDEWIEIIKSENNGGYANTWLIGDVNTAEIARIDLGLKYVGVERTVDGSFQGFNVAEDLRVRNQECGNSEEYSDIRKNGARRTRLAELLAAGAMDRSRAKLAIADHYDVYTGRSNSPCSRTVCGHMDLDDARYGSHADQGPFYPWGANDGKVADAELIRGMAFEARWGHACGMPFDPPTFLNEHPQYRWLEGMMRPRERHPWTTIGIK